MLDACAEIVVHKARGQGLAAAAIQREPHLSIIGLNGLALYEARRIGDVHGRHALHRQKRGVVELPGKKLLQRHGLGHMVDGLQPRSSPGLFGQRRKIRLPEIGTGLWRREADQGSADAAQSGYLKLIRAGRLIEGVHAHGLGPRRDRSEIPRPKTDGADRGAVGDGMRMGEAGRFLIEHKIDPALAPARDLFGPVLAGRGKPQSPEQALQFVRLRTMGGEFQKGEAGRPDPLGQGLEVSARPHAARYLVFQIDQRAPAILGDLGRRPGAEAVVEDLQGQGSFVPGLQDLGDIGGQVEIALARKTAKMPAPVQEIHRDGGRIGDLDQKDLFPVHGADALGRHIAGQRMEAVQNEPDRRMIRLLHHLPGLAMVEHVTPPG